MKAKKEFVRLVVRLVLPKIIYQQSVNCVIEGAYHMNLALCRHVMVFHVYFYDSLGSPIANYQIHDPVGCDSV